MKEKIKSLLKMFKRKQPVYGGRIFEQRDWLTKKVDDAVWKKTFSLDR
jgi:hypothetical protein